MAARREGLSRILNEKLVLAACVLVSVALLTMDEDERIRQAGQVTHRIATPVEWFVDLLDGVVTLKGENQELRSRLAALELDLRHLEAERARWEDLEARAGFHEQTRGRVRPATVLEVLVHRFPVQAKIRSFGEGDSLRVWQPVVTEDGLVGRIREVLEPDVALVELLTDRESRISVEVQDTGVLGLLRYDGRSFWMDQVPRGESIAVGARLRTSGLGGTVPRGLPVGTVRAVESSPMELFQEIQVEPAVRFGALRHVYVVVRPGPWYSRLSETPAAMPPEGGADR